ncbi:MAG: hypothetical protein JSW40_08110 [Candidatus Omnitrophota bacterium]|nr:MAG: hypothetical protein JSW40_08110 [Candidatus Omnitrophota bacterium]
MKLKFFRVVSLGDEDVSPDQILEALSREITVKPHKPDAFFTVMEYEEEKKGSLGSESETPPYTYLKYLKKRDVISKFLIEHSP